MSHMPAGPLVDTTPRPLPARVRLRGREVELEPLHVRHAPELWQAAQGAEDSWAFLSCGPFADQAAFTRHVAGMAASHDPVAWAVRPVSTGLASGWIALTAIEPFHATIRLGHVWFSPRLQRTRAATESMFLLLRLAADELGYRRLGWWCDAQDATACRAAERLGFRSEGVLRAHRVVKGRQRDAACFSILAEEWPVRRNAILAWLDPANFASDGTARTSLRAGGPEPGQCQPPGG